MMVQEKKLIEALKEGDMVVAIREASRLSFCHVVKIVKQLEIQEPVEFTFVLKGTKSYPAYQGRKEGVLCHRGAMKNEESSIRLRNVYVCQNCREIKFEVVK